MTHNFDWKAATATLIKSAVSVAAGGLIVLHLLKPNLKVDSTTLGLLAIMAIPWVSSFLESAKLPGGLEIKFRDIRDAAEKIAVLYDADPARPLGIVSDVSHRSWLPDTDPNLALVGLRIQIERSIRKIAVRFGLPSEGPLGPLVHELALTKHIPAETAEGVRRLVTFGNRAAHGAKVEDGVSEWAKEAGPNLIHALNRLANP